MARLILLALFSLAAAMPAKAQVSRWEGQIRQTSLRFGLPEDWIRRVMRAESGGRTLVGGQPIVSRAGAMGLMQLMPGTWSGMRLALALGPDPHDPADNILAGVAYLRLMYDRFGYPGLFAAYNAGPRRYAAGLAGIRSLPPATRSYLAAVAPASRQSFDVPGSARNRAAAGGRSAADRAAAWLAPRSDGLFVQLRSSARRSVEESGRPEGGRQQEEEDGIGP